MRDITMCHPRLQELASELVKVCAEQGLIIKIGETLRTVAEQDELYAQGRTKPGNIVTNARGSSYSSQHQWGIAFDFFRNDGQGAYNESRNFFGRVGAAGKQIGLGWGGDWKSIVDKPHLYLPDWGSTTAQLRQQYGTPEKFMESWPKPDVTGWERDTQGKYRYRKPDGQYAANEWQLINHHWYLFDADGYMLTGWQKWNGRVVSRDEPGDWYFLDNTAGGPLEGACWHERPGGAGAWEIWNN
ncbi:M15 family metallopeptidase [[Clostridium] symbiosum]|uniref:M15 family metallopeptidase n=1 Tax=Clostridium symbiosum TaxID=1512 RepID=UPI001D096853|nr:M15 family metallopeptidase [[Clostridium] symbiosum]MCB6610178.1 M15 family metallopeptidase [[Clostridium] symbiosum]MCB6933514.1 M15 family metallopeptidase [[Clostridium] symbiosum]